MSEYNVLVMVQKWQYFTSPRSKNYFSTMQTREKIIHGAILTKNESDIHQLSFHHTVRMTQFYTIPHFE